MRAIVTEFNSGKEQKSITVKTLTDGQIRERLEELAGIFGIDILGFAVMSNHLHVVVRTRPDVVRGWSDDEVARRWWNLFPQRREEDHSAAEPTEFELNMTRNNKTGLAEKRKRFSDISWFMRCLAEPIARRGNKEDQVTGRFWEGRFRAQPLLDETAIAACMAYVDLNPIRAGVASSLETSDFTSVQERIIDRQAASDIRSPNAQYVPKEEGDSAGWLSPIALAPLREGVAEKETNRRASNKGCLSTTLDDYFTLLDWTGRQIRKETSKQGRILSESPSILERLKCDAQTWLDYVHHFRRRFRNEVGLPDTRRAFRESRRARRQGSRLAS